MSKAKLLSDKLPEIYAEVERLRTQMRQIIDAAIESCPHELAYVWEIPFREGPLFTHLPKRVCINCGLSEEGWGCGYRLLGKNVYSGIAAATEEMWRQVVSKFVPQEGESVYYVR